MNKRASEAHNKKTPAPAPGDVSPEAAAAACIKGLWLGTCARFTILCLILLVTSAIASASLTVTYVDTVRFFLLLPFGLCLTLAAWVRRSDKLTTGARVSLHALSTLGGFYLFCYLPYQLRTKPSGMQIFVILLLAVIVYAVTMAIVAAVTAKNRQKVIDDTPYESQFRKD